MIGPVWFTPVNRNRGGAGLTGLWNPADGVDEDSDDEESGLVTPSEATGAIPQRPNTQPPMRRPSAADFRGVAVELVLVLSAEMTGDDSMRTLLPAATEANSDLDVFSELLPRSTVIIGADTTGGVDTSSTLGDTMRWGMRMPARQSPIREKRLVGV